MLRVLFFSYIVEDLKSMLVARYGWLIGYFVVLILIDIRMSIVQRCCYVYD